MPPRLGLKTSWCFVFLLRFRSYGALLIIVNILQMNILKWLVVQITYTIRFF